MLFLEPFAGPANMRELRWGESPDSATQNRFSSTLTCKSLMLNMGFPSSLTDAVLRLIASSFLRFNGKTQRQFPGKKTSLQKTVDDHL